MTTALATRDETAVALPKEQIELIRKTVAAGATDTELQLFLYDCSRRGIHPLDRLLHFTKRGGRYTPVTSIDFMRSQAAMSGEMAGSDDPTFELKPISTGVGHLDLESATVTVYRLTAGQRFAYTATARWSEYCPDNAPMWKRMPHTMLGKCAEALALRKAFPQQLAGLYSREEMDQADKGGYTVEAPRDSNGAINSARTVAVGEGVPQVAANERTESREAVARDVAQMAATEGMASGDVEGPDQQTDALYLERVEATPTKNKNVTKYTITLSDGNVVGTIKTQLAALCEQLAQEHCPVAIETKETRWGVDLLNVARLSDMDDEPDHDHAAPLTEDDIPF